jgi:EAL domain-containing protein (putative c-di-GMP-specific phosphodiesterase class I)
MRHADIALYAAKRAGERQLGVFAPPMLARLSEQVWLRDALHGALARGEFALHYQPQRRLSDGRIIGVETLLRWPAPQGLSLAEPARLVEVAEECGLIEPIGTWVLREACRQAQAWPDLTVAVNVSALQFRSDRFVEQVEQALHASALPAHRLELELTESVLVDSDGTVPQRLGRLRDLGVRLALDDFGTGYSSLSYLQRFRVDRLKIDRSFIRRMEQSGGADTDADADAALVAVVIQIARQLGFETVAEGVESPDSLAALARLGCDVVQGYAVARPMPAAALSQWLADQDRAGAGPVVASA